MMAFVRGVTRAASIAWLPDGSGFHYTRYPQGSEYDRKVYLHRLGAALTNAPSCNGWTFWHYEDRGRLLPLDVLRARLRPLE